jgi:hypothetical protein
LGFSSQLLSFAKAGEAALSGRKPQLRGASDQKMPQTYLDATRFFLPFGFSKKNDCKSVCDANYCPVLVLLLS